MALLHAMTELDLSPVAAHYNHRLREEANQEAEFVQKVADLRDRSSRKIGRWEKHLGIDHGQPGLIHPGDFRGCLQDGTGPVTEVDAGQHSFHLYNLHNHQRLHQN